MRKFFILLSALLMSALTAHAGGLELSVHLPETFMKVQEYTDAYFNTVITNKGNSADVHLEYSTDDFKTVHDGGSYTVNADSQKIVRISDNLPKGSYILSVRITADDEVQTASQRMAVMQKYEEQFMDDYTRIGVHVGLPIPNIAKSTYFPDKKRVENSLRLLEMSGIRMVRYGTSTTWEGLEDENGGLTDKNARIDYINSIPPAAFFVVSVSNANHGGVMKTREQMDAFSSYVKKRLATRMPKHQFYAELGNEPDLDTFWTGRDVTAIQYTNLIRYMYTAMKEAGSDYSLIGGATSGGTNAVPFLENMFGQDAYKYLDGYSYHPYIKSSGVDGKYDSFTKPYEDAAAGKGGWLQKMITEIGWDSAWTGTSSVRSHEQIAEEMTKVFLKSYLHDLDLTCYYSLVNNLGLQPQNDFSVASAAVVAASQITSKLNSALYVGEYQLADGAMCMMFIRENKPLMAVWMPGEDSIEFTFDTPVTVEDMYGNVLYESDTVTIDDSVYYISGFGEHYLNETAEHVKNSVYEKVIEAYGEKFDTSILKSNSDVSSHYDVGDRLIDEYIAGRTTLELNELSEALYTLHLAGEKMANLYALNASGTGISEKYASVKTAVDSRKGERKLSTILYTDKIMKYAGRFYSKAKDAEKRENAVMKQGIIASCSLVSDRLSRWAEKIMSLEEVDDTIAVMTITDPVSTEFYQSTKDVEVKYTVDNKRINDINGDVVVINGDGKIISEPVPVTVASGEYIHMMIKVPNDYSNKENDIYKICLRENGKIINEKWFPVTRQKVLEAELDASQAVFNELSAVSVKLTNNTPDTVNGTVNLTAPEGWSLKDSSLEYTLSGFETKLVDFDVTAKKQIPFNLYSFDVEVIQSDNAVLFSKKLPLNFSVLIKSDREYSVDDFDGDITDWQNAYPLYAAPPENPDDMTQWKSADTAAMAFYKYDDNYIYIMANVFDNIFHGKNTGTNMWRNDSIQMLFDPLNNAGETPQADDIAFIMGHTQVGRECLKTLGPNGVTQSNNVSYENAIKVIRDNSINQTRYLIKLPISAVAPLESRQGNSFRTNICFNDSDVEDRNNVIQITKGLSEGGAKRNPSLYYEFVFSGFDSTGGAAEECRLDLMMKSDPLDFK